VTLLLKTFPPFPLPGKKLVRRATSASMPNTFPIRAPVTPRLNFEGDPLDPGSERVLS
jgi:hypothetical protein